VIAPPPGAHPDEDAPYVAGSFRWRLGLRPLDLDDWLRVDEGALVEWQHKQHILDQHPQTAMAWLPHVEPEAQEVLDAVKDHLRRRAPDHLERCGPVDSTRHPLESAGRLTTEDLVMMVERDGRLVVGGGVVAAPNRWDLRSKIGRTLAEVHAPVAQLNAQLAGPIDGFFDRLRPERSWWRLGWGLLATDQLYLPLDGTGPAPEPLPLPGDTAAECLYVRVERETLRRFPRTGVVLFTIGTTVRPLSHLAGRPADAARLAEALGAFPDDVAAYKGVESLRDVATEVLSVMGLETTA
jgi:dimethylamine monooxygenase subunit A